MKISALALAAVAQVASAHYFFDTNIIGGTAQPAFKYVRQSSRAVKYNPIKFSSNPAADIRDGSTVDGPDIVCNQGAFASAGKTEVLTVNGGEEVRLRLAVGAKFQHPGPGLVYMSKAPSSVKTYDESGEWFKIYEEGVCDGEYLVRMEHIGVHRSHVNQPEHYVSCMQVKVTGGGSGTPGPTVKFPGAYKATDAYANFSIYNGRKAFLMPSPAIWTGGDSGSGSSSGTIPVEQATTSAPAAAKSTTIATAVKLAPTAAAPATGGAAVARWGQCGGKGYTGATACASGATCTKANDYYSQCL
ncbi:hypothetical protein E8E11_007490 [Didymella keratinophila]|nr:hypothetical protein E8E11_007490 [Didymella keratinophila]